MLSELFILILILYSFFTTVYIFYLKACSCSICVHSVIFVIGFISRLLEKFYICVCNKKNKVEPHVVEAHVASEYNSL